MRNLPRLPGIVAACLLLSACGDKLDLEERAYPAHASFGEPVPGHASGLPANLTVATNLERVRVEQASTERASSVRVTSFALFSGDLGGSPYTEIYVSAQNFGSETVCDVAFDLTVRDDSGETLFADVALRLEGALYNDSPSTFHGVVCLAPGATAVGFTNDRPERNVVLSSVTEASFAIDAYNPPIKGRANLPELEQLEAVAEAGFDDAVHFRGVAKLGDEALSGLSLSIFVRDPAGYYRDQVEVRSRGGLVPGSEWHFEDHDFPLRRTDAADATDVFVAYQMDVED